MQNIVDDQSQSAPSESEQQPFQQPLLFIPPTLLRESIHTVIRMAVRHQHLHLNTLWLPATSHPAAGGVQSASPLL